MKKFLIICFSCFMLISLTACGKSDDDENETIMATESENGIPGVDAGLGEENSDEEQNAAMSAGSEGNIADDNTFDNNTGESTSQTAEERALKERFGENCIASQTFEVELSEYDGKVWFVPFAPSGEQDFYMQIIRDGEVLADIPSLYGAYVPDELAGEEFVSLDAVSFFDVNYDNTTDIVLIETYGDTSFVAVYYGSCIYDTYDTKEIQSAYFYVNENLSDHLTNGAEKLTIPVIRDFLGNGKKNGEYTDYKEAYLAVGKLLDMESNGKAAYNLIYFDEDDIPELVTEPFSSMISMYTFHDGIIYTVIDGWGYGAGGNHGYEYSPGKNSLRNYNTDYAGLILFTTYMTIGKQYTMDLVVSIQTNNFDDANGNGIPDESEEGSFGYYSVSFIDGEEVTEADWAAYDMGAYENIGADMSLEELELLLSK